MTRSERMILRKSVQDFERMLNDVTDSVDRLELKAWINCMDWTLCRFRHKKPIKRRR